uniref:Uncharacterized protein n=1 Tax=Coturnix japonica TaxID=93934 RepID=A0A8C2THZ0_COTJA
EGAEPGQKRTEPGLLMVAGRAQERGMRCLRISGYLDGLQVCRFQSLLARPAAAAAPSTGCTCGTPSCAALRRLRGGCIWG